MGGSNDEDMKLIQWFDLKRLEEDENLLLELWDRLDKVAEYPKETVSAIARDAYKIALFCLIDIWSDRVFRNIEKARETSDLMVRLIERLNIDEQMRNTLVDTFNRECESIEKLRDEGKIG